MPDAVVIGSGPNGLVAANLLADAGWSVVVLEQAHSPGGCVRSGELVEPGFVSDLFSAFYPFAVASPHIRRLELERHGLHWRQAPYSVAHPSREGSCPAVSTDPQATYAALEEDTPGDGEAWMELYALWERIRSGALGAFFAPFPPVRPVARLLREFSPPELLRLARLTLLPVRRLGEETFRGEGATRLLAGNALHADVSPESPLSGAFGWVLCSLAQQVGFPAPEGGAGEITAALVRRLQAKGGELRLGARALQVECRGGRAVAVRTEAERLVAEEAVIADVTAPALYRQLLDEALLPVRLRADLERFQFDNSTVKVDWTLDGPVPWRAERATRAATVHVATDLNALTRHSAELACRHLPAEPYLVFGQYSAMDATRAPAGKASVWAYTHVPQEVRGDAGGELSGRWDEAEAARFADRMEEQVEALAPGFRTLIRARHIFTPLTLEQANPNLVGGALNGGTAQIYQQLVFRPTPGLARPDTPVARLYLGSASAHPGGGVHGGPGANAALAALRTARRRPGARLAHAVAAHLHS
jgi:phytoene dehydrogenase-like protein